MGRDVFHSAIGASSYAINCNACSQAIATDHQERAERMARHGGWRLAIRIGDGPGELDLCPAHVNEARGAAGLSLPGWGHLRLTPPAGIGDPGVEWLPASPPGARGTFGAVGDAAVPQRVRGLDAQVTVHRAGPAGVETYDLPMFNGGGPRQGPDWNEIQRRWNDSVNAYRASCVAAAVKVMGVHSASTIRVDLTMLVIVEVWDDFAGDKRPGLAESSVQQIMAEVTAAIAAIPAPPSRANQLPAGEFRVGTPIYFEGYTPMPTIVLRGWGVRRLDEAAGG